MFAKDIYAGYKSKDKHKISYICKRAHQEKIQNSEHGALAIRLEQMRLKTAKR